MRFSPKMVGVLAAIVIACATAHRSLTPLDITLMAVRILKDRVTRVRAIENTPDLIADGAYSTRATA